MFAVSYSYKVFAGSEAMAVPGQGVKYPGVLVIQRLSAVKVPVVLLALFSLLKPLQSDRMTLGGSAASAGLEIDVTVKLCHADTTLKKTM